MTSTGPIRINPSEWNSFFRYGRAPRRPAPTQLLTLAGQGLIDDDGDAPARG